MNALKKKTEKGSVFLRVLCFLIGFGLFFWFAVPLWVRIINIGNAIGLVLSLLVMVAAVFWDLFERGLSRCRKRPVMRVLMAVVCVILCVAVLCTAVLSVFMVSAARKAPPEGEKVTVVVLGCKVNGSTPSVMLARRLDTALTYLAGHPDAKCIVSGGKGNGEDLSEAQAMFDYLTARGIAPERIFKEDRSTNTEQNIRFSREIIEKEGLPKKIVLATDGFHQLRAFLFAKREGLTPFAISARTPWYAFSAYYVRELLALVQTLVFKL